MSRCTSCGEEIVWARTEGGKLMPVDVEPSLRGNVVLARDGGTLRAFVSVSPVDGGHLAHFATCPNSDRHRRR